MTTGCRGSGGESFSPAPGVVSTLLPYEHGGSWFCVLRGVRVLGCGVGWRRGRGVKVVRLCIDSDTRGESKFGVVVVGLGG